MKKILLLIAATLFYALPSFAQTVAAPVFSLTGGTYVGSQGTHITDGTTGATLEYCYNGAGNCVPGSTGTTVTGYTAGTNIYVGASVYFCAQATYGGVNSAITCVQYVITSATNQAAAPTFSLSGGSYTGTQTLTLATTTSGATIFYTEDGTNPTIDSTVYTAPIQVSASMTVKAIAAVLGINQRNINQNSNTSTGSSTSIGWKAICDVNDSCGGQGSNPVSAYQQTYNNSTVSLDGSAMHLSISTTATSGDTDALFAYDAGQCDECTTIVADYAFSTGATVAAVANYEQDTEIFDKTDLQDYTYGFQCNQTAGVWQYSSQTSGWISTGVACQLSANTFYRIQSYYHRVIGDTACTSGVPCEYFDGFSVNGTYHALGLTVASTSLPSTYAGVVILQYQIDLLPPTSGTSTGTMDIDEANILASYPPSSIVSNTYTVTQLPSLTAPSFTPTGGTFSGSGTITLGQPSGQTANIYYTTDGTMPTASSNLYANPFTISTSTVVNAIAIESGYSNSQISTASFTVTGTTPVVATPTPSEQGGNFTTAQTLSFTDATSGSTIYCTTNGATPTTSSPVCGTITVTQSETVTARAFVTGDTPSNVITVTFGINLPATVATPYFSVPAGPFYNEVSFSLGDTTPGVTFRCTFDGSTPTASSPLCPSPVSLTSTTTVNVIATLTGDSPSAVLSGTYTITTLQVSTPVFSVAAGRYLGAITVSITSDGGATIYYTTDGSTPTASSLVYNAPLNLTTSVTINAIATYTNEANSQEATAIYVIAGPFVAVSGTEVEDASGNKLASGTAIFAPTDAQGHPISFRPGGGGSVLSRPVQATVTNGSYNLSLADVSLSSPTDFCYAMTVIDNTSGAIVLQYACLQPTGASFSTDNFSPSTQTLLPLVVGFSGTKTAGACTLTIVSGLITAIAGC